MPNFNLTILQEILKRLESIENLLSEIGTSQTPSDQPQPLPSRVFLTIPELSEMIDVPVGTIREWRRLGNLGPKSIKIGGRVKYKLSTVNAWIAANERTPG